ncbi:MAG TPA: polysaccharide biosynthesis protein, partial [Terriglobia bacterium]|nr:polysaccharide biosynthesis protein [Terriglobia bacterium]
MLLPLTDRRVLLTGAGGSIGSALAREILTQKPEALFLLDHSEGKLHQLNFELSHASVPGACVPILGDVTDGVHLAEIFDEKQPDFVLHAAAFKHVPLMETNVIAAVRNNALATNELARLAVTYEVQSLVMVSTDKAVQPHSVMGVTKRVAELALLRWCSAKSSMRAVRLGNVLGSQGSVVPTFLQQIAAGGPVTVTHPEATRYFFSMPETIELIVLAASLAGQSGIFIPQPREAIGILNLARQLIGEAGGGREIPVVMTGLRPGDKLSEQFASCQESVIN